MEKKKYSRWDTPNDKRQTATDRDASIIHYIFETGPTKSSAIQKLFFQGNGKRACQRVLMRLARRGFLYKPGQQRERENANYTDMIYEITAFGRETLLKRNIISQAQNDWYARLHTRGRYLNFWHQVYGADVMASIRIGLKDHPKIRFISLYDILAFAPPETQARKSPLLIDLPNGLKLAPDDFFGLSYAAVGEAPQYMFYAREDDLANEPAKRIHSTGSSFYEKLLKYKAALEGGHIHKHFGITAPVVILTATTSKRHLETILGHLAPMQGKWREHLAFQSTPWLDPFKRPETIACLRCSGKGESAGKTCHRCKGRKKVCKPPDDRLFTLPYRRVGYPEFNLARPT
jgi:hypothetical protein